MEKKNTGLIVLFVILSILVVGLGTIVVYDKFLKNEKEVDNNEQTDNSNLQEENASIYIKKLTGNEYNEKDGSIKNIETEYIVINSKSEYAKERNQYYLNKAQEQINEMNNSIIKQEDENYYYYIQGGGVLNGLSMTDITIVKENNSYNNVGSVLIQTTYGRLLGSGGGYFDVENINLSTGKKVTNSELLRMYQLNEKDISNKIKLYLDDVKSDSSKCVYATSTNINDYKMYIDSNNNLQIIISDEISECIDGYFLKIN